MTLETHNGKTKLEKNVVAAQMSQVQIVSAVDILVT